MTNKEERDAAAESESQFCWCSSSTCSGCEKHTEKLVKIGWDKCLESSVVQGLVEALKLRWDHDADCLDANEEFNQFQCCECGASEVIRVLKNYESALSEVKK